MCFEQALAALAHLPDSRAASEQAIDLQLGLRTALNALREPPGRMHDHLRRAETLAEALGDPQRLGWVYAEMSANCLVAGEVDRAIVYGQRALALATTLEHVGLQARAHFHLGQVYYDAGDYPRAVESLERNVATLHRDLLAERFGYNGSVAVSSRAWLSYCHAERGAFAEGLATADEGLRIAETVQNPFSLIEAGYWASMVYLRQGDVQRALPVVERERLVFTYPDLFALMKELRGMGEVNAAAGRDKRFAPKKLFARADEIYRARYPFEGGIRATFEVLVMAGWTAHESQQRPLKPGEAEFSLETAVNARGTKV